MRTAIELGSDGVTRERVFHATARGAQAWTHPYTERMGCSVCVARIRTSEAREDLTRPASAEELRVPREELIGATIETTELLADPTETYSSESCDCGGVGYGQHLTCCAVAVADRKRA